LSDPPETTLNPSQPQLRPRPANRIIHWWVPIALIAVLTSLIATDIQFLRLYFNINWPSFAWNIEDFESKYIHLATISIGLIVLWKKGARYLLDGIIALVLSSAIVFLLKHGIGRVRPCDSGDPFLYFGPSTAHEGYPSGHSAAVWVIVFAVLRAYTRIGYLWVILGLIVAWARIHALAHYPSDVVAGVITAFFCERPSWRLAGRLRREPRESNADPTKKPSNARSVLVWTIVGLLTITLPIGFALPFRTPIPPPMTDDQSSSTIHEIYLKILGRPIDERVELDRWMTKLRQIRIVSDPVFEFATSGEFYRSVRDRNPGPADRVRDTYWRVLNRQPTRPELERGSRLIDTSADSTEEQRKNRLKAGIRLLTIRLIVSEEYAQHFGAFKIPSATSDPGQDR